MLSNSKGILILFVYGHLEIIVGGMFAGKTEELIRRIRRAIIAQQDVQVFKHNLDARFDTDNRIRKIVSHDGRQMDSQAVQSAYQINHLVRNDTKVVGIDEIQFFDEEILPIIDSLVNRGTRVIVAGLDLDFRGEPFGIVPHLMAIAEDVTKLHAICNICGNDASRSQRLINQQVAGYHDPIILVGAQETYEARCRQHHLVPRDM